jgi:hypothetical protein
MVNAESPSYRSHYTYLLLNHDQPYGCVEMFGAGSQGACTIVDWRSQEAGPSFSTSSPYNCTGFTVQVRRDLHPHEVENSGGRSFAFHFLEIEG